VASSRRTTSPGEPTGNAMKPRIQCVLTHWMSGFRASFEQRAVRFSGLSGSAGRPEGVAADKAQEPGLGIRVVGYLDPGTVLAG